MHDLLAATVKELDPSDNNRTGRGSVGTVTRGIKASWLTPCRAGAM